jgi:chromosome segregation ATPase
MSSIFRTPLLVLALLSAPLALGAQQVPAPPAQQQQQQMQAWFTELQQVGARIQAAQARALADEALSARHRALGAEIEAAVIRLDPSLAQLPQRVQELEAQLRDAYEKRDQARFQQLAQQGQQLEARFAQVRAQALTQGDLANRVRAFEADLEKKMLEAEPELPRLMERGRELQARLEAAAGRAAGRP